jgi:hypothetical protein
MVVRTYLDKTNTIISGSNINTGKNPVSELFYGVNSNGDWVKSRLLIHFDLTKIYKQFTDGMLGDLSKVKHTLNLVNTGAFHDDIYNKETSDGKKRTNSFDLVVFEAPQFWDEGVGYDYNTGPETIISRGASNWKEAETNVAWGTSWEDLTNPTIIASTHFANGNENLEIDITEWVNNLINTYDPNNDNNYGLVIAFDPTLELEPNELTRDIIEKGIQYVGFFTNNTQTFYEPFIETKYSSYIRDDRRNFTLDKPNKLYLYVNANGEPQNLDSLPTVSIMDNLGTTLPGPFTVVREKKGVYYTELEITSNNFTTQLPTYFSDIWSNIVINGRTMNDVQMGFEIQNNNFYDIGMGIERPQDYKIVISGLRHNESIKRGDVRKIYTNAIIPYTVDQKVLLDSIKYRLYVKEGNIEHTVIDYEPVERSYKDNYLLLDTDSLLPNVYYLDIRMELNQEVKTTSGVISFQVVE